MDTIAYVLFPKLTTTQRNNLTNIDNTGVEEGAIIYNVDRTRLELKLPERVGRHSNGGIIWQLKIQVHHYHLQK